MRVLVVLGAMHVMLEWALLVWNLIVWNLMAVEGHQVSYHDCSRPTNLERLDAYTSCGRMDDGKRTEHEEYYLLQRVRNQRTTGYKCQKEVSDFRFYCGSFSHMKLLQTPTIDVTEPVTPEQCRAWVTTQQYWGGSSSEASRPYGPSPTSRDLILGGTTVLAVNALGVIHPEGAVSCEGEKVRVGGELLSNIIELQQVKISLLPEEFVIEGSRLESLTTHSRLPVTCSPHDPGCQTGEGTYIWDPPLSSCALKSVQKVHLTVEGHLHVDHTHKLIFEVDSTIPSPFGCPEGVQVLSTNWPDLYLTPSDRFDPIPSSSIDLAKYSDTRDDYLEYNIERKMNGMEDSLMSQLCETRFTGGDRIFKVGDRFGFRAGDAFLIFDCLSTTGTVAEPDGQCYTGIRLQEGVFVDPRSRIASMHAVTAVCSDHFPQYVKTMTGQWITISDKIKQIDPPQTKELLPRTSEGDHESFAVPGLYTQEELLDWEALVSWGAFHEATVQEFSRGVCKHESGPCGGRTAEMGTKSYDLSRLINPATFSLSLMERLNNWVQANVGYLCLIALVVYSIQWGIAIIMAIHSVFSNGLGTALASLYVMCCSTPHLIARTQRHDKKRRQRQRGAEEQVMMSELAETELEHVA